MLQKVKIKSVKIYERPFRKEGDGVENPSYVYKKGKHTGENFVMVNIQTEETGDEYYSTPETIGGEKTKLMAGQTRVLNLTETTAPDGGKTFKNFSFPSQKELEVFNQFNPQ